MAKVKLTDNLKSEYQELFNSCYIYTNRKDLVESIIARLLPNQNDYEDVASQLGIPWYFIAVIHNMESSLNFSRHLHNGDPLINRTVHVPKDRPRDGNPPFSWVESAIDALKHRRLHLWDDWSVPGLLYQIEGYNGWGYRLYHSHVLSPYLWSYSNHYTSGKYVADGSWSDTAVSRQCGASVLLRRMAEKRVIDLEAEQVPTPVVRAINQGKPILRYSSSGKIPYAQELQEFLNQLPDIYVKPDGWPGKNTSEAFKKVTGNYLHGDPKI